MTELASLIIKHINNYRWSALLLLLGFITTVTTAMAIPMYAESVNQRLLSEGLDKQTDSIRQVKQPLDLVFRYIGAWHEPVGQAEWKQVNDFLIQHAESTLRIPVSGLASFISTPSFQLNRWVDGKSGERLERIKLSAVSGVEEQIQLVEGSMPKKSDDTSVVIEVLCSLDFANRVGIKPGDALSMTSPATGSHAAYIQRFLVTGIWIPSDAKSDYWQFYPSEALQNRLILPLDSWMLATQSLVAPVDEAAWRIQPDGSAINSTAVDSLLANIQRLNNQVTVLLKNTDLETSPVQALQSFRSHVRTLMGSIFAFSLPVFCLFCIFLIIISELLISAQRNEIAVMRGRGFSRLSILARYFLEYSLLGIFALLISLPLSRTFVAMMGRTSSFLVFSSEQVLIPKLTSESILIGGLAMLVCVLVSLWSVWKATQDTIISYKQEKARATKPPFWKRFFLDFGILFLSSYGVYTVSSSKTLSNPQQSTLGDPLHFILPFLIILSTALVFLRLLPFFNQQLSKLFAHMRRPEPVFITRQLTRSLSSYSGILMLMIITLALATYTTTMAASLDRNLTDSIKQQIGADLSFFESGEYLPGLSDQAQAVGETSNDSSAPAGLWNFIPLETYQNFPDVDAATRVGTYSVSVAGGGRNQKGSIVGIDRHSFSQVAFFRNDFASEPLNGLLNRLATSPDAVLVDQQTWQKLNLKAGDRLNLDLTYGNESVTVSVTAAGIFIYFPGFEPQSNSPLFVGNLGFLFEAMGGLQPYKIWLKTVQHQPTASVTASANQLGVSIANLRSTSDLIREAMVNPARQGVLGLLSIGFIISSLLAVISFSLYGVSSLKNRAVHLGVFRAIGMSLAQLKRTIQGELLFLITTSLILGTFIGWLTSIVLISSLPVSLGNKAQLLPRLITYDWGKVALVYFIYSVTLAIVSYALTKVIERMKLFAVIKLGETV